MPDMADIIWIDDAAEKYNRSRRWLKEQVDSGRLSYASIPGDKRLYLLRAELDALFSPQIKRNAPADSAQETA